MTRTIHTLLLTVLLLVFHVPAADARTWRVEKDGSGDFTVIQDAVDAASDGDVIEIGAGRFDDYQDILGNRVRVLLEPSKDLTIIGAGPDATIIGPATYDGGSEDGGFWDRYGSCSITISDLRVENLRGKAITLAYNQVEVTRCVFAHCDQGVFSIGATSSTVVSDCQFVDVTPLNIPRGILSNSPYVRILDCEFTDWRLGVSLSSPSSSDVLVARCTFRNGIVGLQFSSGGSGTVENCYFTGYENYGFTVSNAGDVIFRDCVVEQCSGAGVGLYETHSLTMVNNVVQNCHPCVFVIRPWETITVRDNHFLRDVAGDGYFVRTIDYFPYGPYHLDFTLNHWGTDDAEEVAQWIYDGHDDPDVYMYIDYLPMADVVSVESRSWSGVRALFE